MLKRKQDSGLSRRELLAKAKGWSAIILGGQLLIGAATARCLMACSRGGGVGEDDDSGGDDGNNCIPEDDGPCHPDVKPSGYCDGCDTYCDGPGQNYTTFDANGYSDYCDYTDYADCSDYMDCSEPEYSDYSDSPYSDYSD